MSEHKGPSSQWQKGYDKQMAWLSERTLKDAEITLAERERGAADLAYNRGATQATRDFIESQKGS